MKTTLRILCLFAIASCAPGDPFDRSAMLESIGDEVTLTLYEQLVERSGELEGAATAFCADPTDANLDATRSAFRAAKAPLKQAEVFAFGPYTDSPLRLGPEIDLWPGRATTVDDRLAGTEPVTAEAILAAGGYAKGFPALDHLLFAYELDALAEPRACEYLQSLTTQIRTVAESLLDAWAPTGGDYLGQWVRGEGDFDGVQHSASVLIEQLVFTLENVREVKLGKPLGKRDGGVVQLDAIEAPDSHRSLDDARDAIRGVEAAWIGDIEGSPPMGAEPAIGVRDWLLARKPGLAPEVDAAFAATYAAFDAVSDHLAAAILDTPELVDEVYLAVRDLQVLFAVDVAQALGVTVTFNPTDGD